MKAVGEPGRWMAMKLRWAVGAALCVFAANPYAGEVIGKVMTAVGDVFAVRGANEVRLRTGSVIELGDLVRTGIGSHAQVELADRSIVEFRPRTQFHFVAQPQVYAAANNGDGTERVVFRYERIVIEAPPRGDRPQTDNRIEVRPDVQPPRDTSVERTPPVERAPAVERPPAVERVQRIEKTEKPERIEKVERVEKIEKPERVEKAERPERVEKAERPERVEKIERVERVERIDRSGPDRIQRVERVDRLDGGNRGRN